MKKIFAGVLMLMFTAAASADVQEGQAAYVGGTVTGIKDGTIGKLDTTQEANLVFEHAEGKVVIPYAKIETWDYQEVVAHHVGVIPTLVIVLVKYRQRRHLFHIQFKDEASASQAAVIEVPKQMPKAFSAVLEARVKACTMQGHYNCVKLTPRNCTTPTGCNLTDEQRRQISAAIQEAQRQQAAAAKK